MPFPGVLLVMDRERLLYLFDKYLHRNCSAEEVEELARLMNGELAEEVLAPEMLLLWENARKEAGQSINWTSMYQHITLTAKQRDRGVRLRRVLAAAAVSALVLSCCAYYIFRNSSSTSLASASAPAHDVPPGGNKAVLTLGNGTRIVLDKAVNGTVASQGHTKIVKLGSGQLVCRMPGASEVAVEGNNTAPAKVLFNTLTTPRGGQFRLTLPDGTQVWLNSASSLTFPASFTGGTRQVKMTGEAYFEVAPDASRPFLVVTSTSSGSAETVRVLGTRFNISAYPAEAIKTTLLQGSVQVESPSASGKVVMKPGQQTRLDASGHLKLMLHADVEEAVGWKNGLFVFHDDNLPEVMRRLSRWYDVEVEYRGERMPSHFTGTVRRQENISEVLKMLELTGGAHFSVSGRKVTVIY